MEGRELRQVACSGWLPPLTATAWPGQKQREVGRCCGGGTGHGHHRGFKIDGLRLRLSPPRLEPNTSSVTLASMNSALWAVRGSRRDAATLPMPLCCWPAQSLADSPSTPPSAL
jgi:hypothetical protein